MRLGSFVSLALFIGCLACSSSDDSGKKPADTPRVFTTDALPAGPAVFVRQKALSSTSLQVELVGRNLEGAYGLAWRLEYDPAVLRFTETQTSSIWSPNHVQLSREARPGLLIAGLTSKGNVAGTDWPDTVLATLTFEVLGPEKSRLDFVVARSGVINELGSRATAEFVGGELSSD